MTEKFVAPAPEKDSYHCPHCGVLARQAARSITMRANTGFQNFPPSNVARVCSHCQRWAVWIEEAMRYPEDTSAPPPREDMPSDVREVYSEARSIASKSPRAACGLLRLAIERLMPHLEAEGGSLHKQIGNLVEQGLAPAIQQALDSVRIIGNDAVHGGEIVLDDDRDVAAQLFQITNHIVDQMITRPREMQKLYDSLPENKRAGVEQRDRDS